MGWFMTKLIKLDDFRDARKVKEEDHRVIEKEIEVEKSINLFFDFVAEKRDSANSIYVLKNDLGQIRYRAQHLIYSINHLIELWGKGVK